ncbi:MAG: diacylglycerol kinase family lipid kinase [Clostridia bacterium]|nr:diacylglycerol kinase family lipid kinase [Clostridia bacterium]
MKYWFIVNPVSGKGKFAAHICERIREHFDAADLSYEICMTECRGDATRIAREICEMDHAEKVIFACGGDGMVSEVASGIAGYDAVTLGVIPAGTGNDFVRSFSFPKLFTNLEAQMAGETVLIDAIHYTGDNGLDAYSLNILNMGFDCYVVACADRAKKIPLVASSFAYYVGILMAMVGKPGLKGDISVDGGAFEEFDLMFLLAANGRFYGGGYHPAPYALMQDGKIDLCKVKNVSRVELLRLLDSYKKGTFLTQPRIIEKEIAEYRRCDRFTVRFPKPTAVCGDGEIAETVTLHAEICPEKIRLLLPRGCALPVDERHEEAAEVMGRGAKVEVQA